MIHVVAENGVCKILRRLRPPLGMCSHSGPSLGIQALHVGSGNGPFPNEFITLLRWIGLRVAVSTGHLLFVINLQHGAWLLCGNAHTLPHYRFPMSEVGN